ncbi:hypothetical protein KQI68_06750 [Peptoniphilus sp. MSJ-1]|uniref:HTH cro/C1-type domain-containing protein n=1 Tax=Peptoniphilus ovalis TaxID=2841503 RepID=A0ABS6FH81_9FIRM|nr:hypothetical protein [Peptoniphilus ovalis]MBU5669537.1 hypothetical protein [Peptoniphilus ovalis]
MKCKSDRINLSEEFIEKCKKIRFYYKTIRNTAKHTNLSVATVRNLTEGATKTISKENYNKIINLYNLFEDEIENKWQVGLIKKEKKPKEESKKINIGETYKIVTSNKGTVEDTIEMGKAVKEYPHFYVLRSKNYDFTVLKNDLLNKEFGILKA